MAIVGYILSIPVGNDPERDLINAGAYVILEVNKNYPRTKERKTIAKSAELNLFQ